MATILKRLAIAVSFILFGINLMHWGREISNSAVPGDVVASFFLLGLIGLVFGAFVFWIAKNPSKRN